MQTLIDFFRSLFRFLFQYGHHQKFRRWRRLANTVTRETFMEWLAEQTAKDMLERKPSDMSIVKLAEGVNECPLTDFQFSAERFIENYYHNYPFYDESFYYSLATFRTLIQTKILQLGA